LKRTFIAIKIKPEKPLIDLISEMKHTQQSESLKWVEEFNLHLTLHFIGETSRSQLQSVVNMLRITTGNFPSFVLNISGIWCFGGHSQPRVLLANIYRNEVLELLVKETAKGLAALGLPGNMKSFSPHLTLARVKQLQNLPLFLSTVEKYKSVQLQSALVTEIIFYESILQPAGPVYKPIQIFKLNKQ